MGTPDGERFQRDEECHTCGGTGFFWTWGLHHNAWHWQVQSCPCQTSPEHRRAIRLPKLSDFYVASKRLVEMGATAGRLSLVWERAWPRHLVWRLQCWSETRRWEGRDARSIERALGKIRGGHEKAYVTTAQ